MLSTILIIDKRKELSTKYKKSIDSTETNVIITRTLKDAFITLQNLEPDLVIISDSIEEKLADFIYELYQNGAYLESWDENLNLDILIKNFL